jgi:hypothetical protein
MNRSAQSTFKWREQGIKLYFKCAVRVSLDVSNEVPRRKCAAVIHFASYTTRELQYQPFQYKRPSWYTQLRVVA